MLGIGGVSLFLELLKCKGNVSVIVSTSMVVCSSLNGLVEVLFSFVLGLESRSGKSSCVGQRLLETFTSVADSSGSIQGALLFGEVLVLFGDLQHERVLSRLLGLLSRMCSNLLVHGLFSCLHGDFSGTKGTVAFDIVIVGGLLSGDFTILGVVIILSSMDLGVGVNTISLGST